LAGVGLQTFLAAAHLSFVKRQRARLGVCRALCVILSASLIGAGFPYAASSFENGRRMLWYAASLHGTYQLFLLMCDGGVSAPSTSEPNSEMTAWCCGPSGPVAKNVATSSQEPLPPEAVFGSCSTYTRPDSSRARNHTSPDENLEPCFGGGFPFTRKNIFRATDCVASRYASRESWSFVG
jgi:hypothetical protein